MAKRKRKIKQRQIYMCDLDDGAIDSEQKGSHPVLIASCDVRNDSSSNVFVFPITHANKKFQPTHYAIYKQEYPFLSYDKSIIQCEEGRSISKTRLKRCLGEISEYDFEEIMRFKEFIFKNFKDV
jgi:mRNA-degrading endonuclease toxin of MazEF toxin-antitoxin module